MDILILGGTGLISTPITAQLLEQGHSVTHYNRGKRDSSFDKQVETVLGDRYDHDGFVRQMDELQTGRKFDVVIEMIGFKPEDVEDLSRAFAGKIGQLIFCSTVDVYSKPPARYPIPDTANRDNPAPWDYAQNKSKCEAILFDAADRGDFPLTVLRPAHTYSDGGALLHSLGGSTTYLDRLRKGKPLVVHGDGQSLWVSCHALDVARGFVNACGNSKTFGKGYTLPGEEWLTWNDIHRTVAQAIGAPEPILVHIPTDLLSRLTERAFIDRVNFQYNNIFDTTAARTDLGFSYTIPLSEGARRVYDNLDKNGRITNSDDDPLDDRILAAWERATDGMLKEFSV
ncbi:MAG: SDR family oxidoreductase [Armatimonadaceae bacterium]